MRVLLVHGLGRTPLSLGRLARALRRDGHDIRRFWYLPTFQTMDAVRSRLRTILLDLAAGPPFAVIGHSLGGLLTRIALRKWPSGVPLPAHVVMLGTPNRSPLIARRLHHWWPYRRYYGELGQMLADERFFAELPALDSPYTLIAGTRGLTGRWSPFGNEPNDGLVAVDETRMRGGDVPIEVPVAHSFMMNDTRVRQVIRRVLDGA